MVRTLFVIMIILTGKVWAMSCDQEWLGKLSHASRLGAEARYRSITDISPLLLRQKDLRCLEKISGLSSETLQQLSKGLLIPGHDLNTVCQNWQKLDALPWAD